LNILNWWPLPNISNVPAGQAYNWESTYPTVNLLGWEPVVRLDYAPTQKLRGNFKYQMYQQPVKTIPGTVPGWNDSTQDNFGIYTWSSVINYTVNNTTFVEGSFGRNSHHQEGCSIVGGDPNWCITGDPVNAITNRITAGFGGIPYLFPDATIIDPSTKSYEILNRLGSQTTIWDGTRVQAAPTFAFGTRVANAPPNNSSPFNNFILDTVSAPHDYNAYLGLLKHDGTMILVGMPDQPVPLSAGPLIMGRRRLVGSLIGGIRETQEMLDFCAEHGIGAEIEVIPAEKINDAYERVLASDVRYRFVIDSATLA
jgi:hypothetical protein